MMASNAKSEFVFVRHQGNTGIRHFVGKGRIPANEEHGGEQGCCIGNVIFLKRSFFFLHGRKGLHNSVFIRSLVGRAC
jgi:hypothetical protein